MNFLAGRCVYCSETIDADKDYRKVTGWEKRRTDGGTNTIALREPEDVWACTSCVDRLKQGLSVGQASLI